MRIFPIKKMYLPALSIVAVVFLLLILISISTYRNLDREKSMALHFLYRQGVALIRSLEASARTGMKSLMWQEISLGSLMQETAKDHDIAYVYLVDGYGKIVHHSDPSKQGSVSDWNPKINEADQIATRIVKSGKAHQIYELAKLFAPMYEPSMSRHQNSKMLFEERTPPHAHSGDIIVLGMKMESIAQARRADLQHAFIMAAIILVLGSGALFFIFVIQNYYLVDKTLKQTKDYTRQVIASMANGLLGIDTDGKIASYNQPALDLLDLEESDAKGKDLSSVINFTDSGIRRTITDYIPVLDQEIQHRKKNGEVIPLAISATPIQNEAGTCQGAVIVLRDLSEIKKLQEKVRRSEKLAAIGELAAGIAHEIRNPLSSIRGFAQFLRHALKDKPQEQVYAATMVSEVDRINRVVTDLLTFARPMEAELVPTDITDLIEHTVRLVAADADSRDVSVQTQIADVSRLPLDANQMTQALLNLLLNALQAVDHGGRIEIGADLNADESCLHLWVADNGAGIAPDQREKIFEPFFTTREKGTGLGLAIVHKIVENHQGEIKIESPPAGRIKGCRFTMIIPTNITHKSRKRI
ncbi:MAG: PAS domain-containing protein [Desulfobacterales bacterium]|nr:MAG: PAS domain-containing protein [Desulfobacterales bacterium]